MAERPPTAFRTTTTAKSTRRKHFKRLGGFVLAAMASIAGYFLATTWKFSNPSNGSGDGNREQILLVGDSLTQRGFDSKKGWVSKLASTYARRADVINRGYSGYNTKWVFDLMTRKPNLFVKKPTLVVVFLGANDAAVNHKREYAVSLDEYEKNMRAILSMYKNVPRIVVTPPPIIEKDRVRHARETTAFNTPDRLYQHTEKYAAVAEKVGREMGVGVADAFDRFEKLGGGDLSEYFTDGLHFSERGEEVLFELVMETIKHTYPWVSWERLNLDAPLHGELAEKNT